MSPAKSTRGGLLFYYNAALDRPEAMPRLIGPRTRRTVPVVLNRTEAEVLLGLRSRADERLGLATLDPMLTSRVLTSYWETLF